VKIYLIKSIKYGCYKIGVSKNPDKRLKQLQTGNPSELELLCVYDSEIAFKIEKVLHNTFNINKEHGEWFDLSIKDEFYFINECKKIDETLKFLIKNENKFV
jgi:hypothetical protein